MDQPDYIFIRNIDGGSTMVTSPNSFPPGQPLLCVQQKSFPDAFLLGIWWMKWCFLCELFVFVLLEMLIIVLFL